MMRCKGVIIKILPGWLVAFFLVLFVCVPAYAHEPVFSLGPETIFKGGMGIESEFEFERSDNGHSLELHYEFIYGLTADLSFTLEIPHILALEEDDETSSGLGDIQLRGKYQLFRKDSLGAQDKLSAILGVKIPTGDEDADPRLGTGTTDFLSGLSYGHESRIWYYFATLRYLLRTGDQSIMPGDRFFYDVAAGFRPWQREYLEWDFVALLELNGEFDFQSEVKGHLVPDSGGNTVWLGPTGLFSYRNIMFKGGIQFPVSQDLKGNQDEDEFRLALAAEYHF